MRYRKKYKVTMNNNHKQLVFKTILKQQFNVTSLNSAYVYDNIHLETRRLVVSGDYN